MRISRKVIIILFVVIILISSALRLYKLGDIPVSPDWDEVALGYNAYSISHTGRDEYGQFLPVVLRSFDDYKPALYAYLTIPSILIFDLNVFAVRLPSAIFGVLTVVATFYLIKEFFKVKKIYIAGEEVSVDIMALIICFFLAISPWHIQFSRIAFESNVGLAFNVFVVLFFLKGLKYSKYIVLAALIAALNIYVYQSEKIFTPLLVAVLIIVYRKYFFSLPKKYISFSIVLGLIVLLPMIFFIFSNREVFIRAQGVSIFSKETELLKQSINRLNIDKNNNNLLGFLFDNRRVVYGGKIIENYLSHYNLNWMFIEGDRENNRHHAPYMGLLYLTSLPFLLIGFYKLIFGRLEEGFSSEAKLFIFTWFLLVPVPASITFDIPHAVRTLNFLPIIDVFIGIGAISSFLFLKKIIAKVKIRLLIYIFISFLFLFNFFYYINQYFVQQNYFYAFDWQYGYKETVDYIKPIQNTYKKIIVSNQHELSQSYVFFLFYLKYDPAKYLSEGGTSSGGFAYKGNRFSRFEFRPFDYYKEENNVLLVGSPGDFPEEYKVLRTIYYPNKSVAIKLVEKD